MREKNAKKNEADIYLNSPKQQNHILRGLVPLPKLSSFQTRIPNTFFNQFQCRPVMSPMLQKTRAPTPLMQNSPLLTKNRLVNI